MGVLQGKEIGTFICLKKLRGFRHGQNPLSEPEARGPLLHAVAFLEPFNTPCGVDQFLLAGEERMAGGADLRADFLLGGAGLKIVAAEAFDGNFVVLGVDSFFHIFPPCRALYRRILYSIAVVERKK
jgi:hypothetical protein